MLWQRDDCVSDSLIRACILYITGLFHDIITLWLFTALIRRCDEMLFLARMRQVTGIPTWQIIDPRLRFMTELNSAGCDSEKAAGAERCQPVFHLSSILGGLWWRIDRQLVPGLSNMLSLASPLLFPPVCSCYWGKKKTQKTHLISTAAHGLMWQQRRG